MNTFRIFIVCIVCSSSLLSFQRTDFVKNGNTVICDDVRFEFLTRSMGRMEFSHDGKFTDEPTVVVTNRRFPPFDIDVKAANDWLIVNTGILKLRYRIGSGKFVRENMSLSWKDRSGDHTWSPGGVDDKNLGGITYSLDGARREKLPKYSPGVLSRNGYFILDDSKSPVWNKESSWIEARKEGNDQDWYWIIYKEDYSKALREYTDLTGKIPMIPRYALGTWITDLNYEYLPGSHMVDDYRYSSDDVKKLVERFRAESIPLDVLVLDFAWHKLGWKGSYDWSPLFADPKGFLEWSHRYGIKISLNDHPGYAMEGVLSDEDSHADEVRQRLQLQRPPKASYSIDISKGWRFQIDSMGLGERNHWYSSDFVDSLWQTVQAGLIWENQGYPGYDGLAWYRKVVRYPDVPKDRPIFLVFGGVDDEYDLYINGAKVAHYGSPGSSVWSSLTFKDITSLLRKDGENLIALRVNDWGGGGGISKLPVVLTDVLPFEGIRFNLADKKQAEIFMDVLHHPLIDQGVDFWWIDGGRGSATMDGLDGQMWTNRVFYDFTESHTKKRSFVFSRYGGWGNHRYPAIFTGDTYSDWEVLNYEVIYSAQSGNVLMPYVTHDIGGFLGQKIPFGLYARWIQFGVFNPIVRLHSAFENPGDGNVRMPWTYGHDGVELVKRYVQMRYQLLPYIYTYSRIASDSALPLSRPLYLEYPRDEESYHHPNEYFFGREFLAAPIVDSSGERDVYLPAGKWIDYFTGAIIDGGRAIHQRHTLDDFPLFVRNGSIIPTQPVMPYSDQHSLDTVILEIYGAASAHFNLYEDDGISLDYRAGKSAWTSISSKNNSAAGQRITIGPTTGVYEGMPTRRTYVLRLHAFSKPRNVYIDNESLLNKSSDSQTWNWNSTTSLTTIVLSPRSIRSRIDVRVR